MACAHGLFTWRGPAIVPSLPMATEPRLFAKLSSPKVPSKAIYRQTRFHRKPRWDQLEVNNKRKVLWKHNTIRTNRANRPPPDSKAAKREIARDRNENASSASARSRAAEANPVAANKAAASRRIQALSKHFLCNLEGDWCVLPEQRYQPVPLLGFFMTRLSGAILG
jgi:hypothetical protein